MTNAHVVAGEEDTTVTTRSGASYGVTAVHYDPRNDLAILRAPGLDLRSAARSPTRLQRDTRGDPRLSGGRALRGRAGADRPHGQAITEDSYGRGPIRRTMTPFRGEVRSGNSGGPVVDQAGRVLTTVFAAATGPRARSGLGVPDAIVARALDGPLAPTGTGPCAL